MSTRPATRTVRGPNRVVSRAENPSDRIPIIRAVGTTATPVSIGPYPRTPCRYRLIKNWNPIAAATMSACARLPPDTVRDRSTRSGSSGREAVAWRSTNPARSTSAAAPKPSVCAEAQP